MNIVKAKEGLQLLIQKPGFRQDPETTKAILLGIQALIRISNCRINSGEDARRPLPGETNDGEEG